MNKANLYQHANELQRQDAKQILDEFSYLFRWREDLNDKVLDIGCGSGDVTIDFILPLLPSTFTLVGSDKSDEMIRYARKTYKNKKISFIKMDIGEELKNVLNESNLYDHITSFYCLHWVQNQKTALKNIYNLLRRDGDCLLAFLASNPIYIIYKKLSKLNKWKEYMHDVNSFISPYQYCKDPGEEFGLAMKKAGFNDFIVEVREKIFIFDNVENLKKSVKAVNPFLDRIPKNLHEEFLNDYIDFAVKMDLDLSNGEKFIVNYKLIIAFGKK